MIFYNVYTIYLNRVWRSGGYPACVFWPFLLYSFYKTLGFLSIFSIYYFMFVSGLTASVFVWWYSDPLTQLWAAMWVLSLNLGPLQEQSVLLTPELCLQPAGFSFLTVPNVLLFLLCSFSYWTAGLLQLLLVVPAPECFPPFASPPPPFSFALQFLKCVDISSS